MDKVRFHGIHWMEWPIAKNIGLKVGTCQRKRLENHTNCCLLLSAPYLLKSWGRVNKDGTPALWMRCLGPTLVRVGFVGWYGLALGEYSNDCFFLYSNKGKIY